MPPKRRIMTPILNLALAQSTQLSLRRIRRRLSVSLDVSRPPMLEVTLHPQRHGASDKLLEAAPVGCGVMLQERSSWCRVPS